MGKGDALRAGRFSVQHGRFTVQTAGGFQELICLSPVRDAAVAAGLAKAGAILRARRGSTVPIILPNQPLAIFACVIAPSIAQVMVVSGS